MSKIVPFGKYKGQPVEMLAADRDYCEWLMAQPWFADRFRDVYNVVINYGGQPEETPEHNALQARFLDDEFCMRLGMLVQPEAFDISDKLHKAQANAAQLAQADLADAEATLAAVQQTLESNPSSWRREQAEEARGIVEKIRAGESTVGLSTNDPPFAVNNRRFEYYGWDALIVFAGYRTVLRWGRDHSYEYFASQRKAFLGDVGWQEFDRFGYPTPVCVECKPMVGDDYPAILRQIQRYRVDTQHTDVRGHLVTIGFPLRILLIGQFQAQGATLEQVTKIFAASGIKVVMLAELEAA